MAWRLAGSLISLREEINARAPHRSKRSDGTIGDAAHGARASRHNRNRWGVVTALDVTHDPAGGCDIHAIADEIRRRPHPELAYTISRGRIAGRATGWAWHRYTGSNPHDVHAHFGVGQGPDSNPMPPYDSPQPWGLAVPAPPVEDDMTPDQARKLDEIHTLARHAAADSAAALFFSKLAFDLAAPNGFAYVDPGTGRMVAPGTPGARPALDHWRWTRESVEADREDDDRHDALVQLIGQLEELHHIPPVPVIGGGASASDEPA